jgi:hypothetical protein
MNKAKAFKFMLTEESTDVVRLREELSFYTNQCLAEVKRIGADNAELLTDHFITQSQLQCTYINQVSVWLFNREGSSMRCGQTL